MAVKMDKITPSTITLPNSLAIAIKIVGEKKGKKKDSRAYARVRR